MRFNVRRLVKNDREILFVNGLWMLFLDLIVMGSVFCEMG